jgi:hypothetical protein
MNAAWARTCEWGCRGIRQEKVQDRKRERVVVNLEAVVMKAARRRKRGLGVRHLSQEGGEVNKAGSAECGPLATPILLALFGRVNGNHFFPESIRPLCSPYEANHKEEDEVLKEGEERERKEE